MPQKLLCRWGSPVGKPRSCPRPWLEPPNSGPTIRPPFVKVVSPGLPAIPTTRALSASALFFHSSNPSASSVDARFPKEAFPARAPETPAACFLIRFAHFSGRIRRRMLLSSNCSNLVMLFSTIRWSRCAQRRSNQERLLTLERVHRSNRGQPSFPTSQCWQFLLPC